MSIATIVWKFDLLLTWYIRCSFCHENVRLFIHVWAQSRSSSTHLCGCLWLTLTGPMADFRVADELSSSISMLVRKRFLCKWKWYYSVSYIE